MHLDRSAGGTLRETSGTIRMMAVGNTSQLVI